MLKISIAHSGDAMTSRNPNGPGEGALAVRWQTPVLQRALWAFLVIALAVCANTAGASELFGHDYPCPSMGEEGVTRKDYRLRDTPELKWFFNDNHKYHMAPALDRMRQGDYSVRVVRDLHFTLRRWPNHYLALQTLVSFEDVGGDADHFMPIPCYFEYAYGFVPNDANILVLSGIYQHRLGNADAAEAAWLQAVKVDEQAMEAHYSLGLLYAKQERYDESVEHARIAYDLGYPLPGLRNKLASAGHWSN